MKTMVFLVLTAIGGWAQEPLLQIFAYQGNRDRASQQFDREYERGTRALDKRDWGEAVARFTAAAGSGSSRADGALYWKAYALAKLGRNTEAKAAIDELSRSYAQSRWLNDAKALEVEIAQAAGKPIRPEEETDQDLKLMAINGLLHSDPERTVPLLEKLLQTQSSPRLRERALFVLSQSESPKARDVVVKAAKGQYNPDLQLKAVQSLGVYGGKQNRQLLTEIYSSSNDGAVKRQVLRSFMVAGDREPLLTAAKSDSNPEIRMQAIQLLGAMGAGSQLADLYASEASPEIKLRLLEGMHSSGNSDKLVEIAKSESDPKLRQRAIDMLGVNRSPQTTQALVSMYGSNSDVPTRTRILHALFVQGSAQQLVDIARSETNPQLKKVAVEQLSHMKNKEATDYLLELLK